MTVSKQDALYDRIIAAIEGARATLEQLPGVAIVNDIRDGSVIYMSQRGLKLLGTTLQELHALGPTYHKRFFNPEQAEEYVPQVLELMARNDPSETFTFFQQVRFAGSDEWQWHLSALRIFVQDDDGNPLAVLTLAQHLNAEHHYTRKIGRLLGELDFLKKHMKTFESLGLREREILKLMAEGRSSQEIADKLHISVLTADTHRKNIRRKLGVQRHSELAQFARAFDLV
jgi:DNA-binding CsgD family transcriptional regulator